MEVNCNWLVKRCSSFLLLYKKILHDFQDISPVMTPQNNSKLHKLYFETAVTKKKKISKTCYTTLVLMSSAVACDNFHFFWQLSLPLLVQIFYLIRFCLIKVLINCKMPRYWTKEGREERKHLTERLIASRVEDNGVLGSDCQFGKTDKNCTELRN